MKKDKIIDKEKYENISLDILNKKLKKEDVMGFKKFHFALQSPLQSYQEIIFKYINSEMKVIEIGCGNGNFSSIIAKQSKSLALCDISFLSLKVAKKFLKAHKNIYYQVGDMEKLPFKKNSFDAVLMSGSFSYGEFNCLESEILKILRPNGLFIFIDSLNSNPLYKAKRYIDVLRKKRTLSTYKNLPTLKTINKLSENFSIIDLKFFGSLTWLFKFFPNSKKTKIYSDKIDKLINAKRSSYKIIFIGKKI